MGSTDSNLSILTSLVYHPSSMNPWYLYTGKKLFVSGREDSALFCTGLWHNLFNLNMYPCRNSIPYLTREKLILKASYLGG